MNAKSRGFVHVIASFALIVLILTASGWSVPTTWAQGESPITATNHNCRLWGSVSTAVPGSVIQAQLLTDPNSLKNLSQANPNGWGLGYYPDATSAPVVNRGRAVAYTDPLFDQAVTAAAGLNPPIVVAHVRRCSSGLCNIPNPHPFQRTIDGKFWLMGHNGTIDKSVLLSLIRPDFLAANLPVNGTDQSQWIDSELYFTFMQQTLIDDNYSVKLALGHVIQSLRDKLPASGYPLNFFLTDGTTLWGYRQGNSLYYLYSTYHDNTTNTDIPYSVLASQPTSASQGSWVTMSDGQLVTMSKNAAPVVEIIQSYFSPASPSNLKATAGNAQVTLSWSASSSNGSPAVTVYNIYRGTSSRGEQFLGQSAGLLTYSDTAVTNGTTYYYQVTAVNANGESAKSSEVSAIPSGKTLSIAVVTDKTSYTRGSFVYTTVTVKDNAGKLVQGASIKITVAYPNGSLAWTSSGTTNASGVARVSHQIGRSAPTGTYKSSATASLAGYQSGTGQTTFKVTG
jgi:predicted glutamine amidotransferase